MGKRILHCLFILVFCALVPFASGQSYETFWKRYDSFNKALVRDANKKLDTIELKANKEGNELQQLRVHFERLRLNQRYNNAWRQNTAILYMDSIRQQKHSAPYLCLYNYIIATLLDNYYSNNYYSSSIGNTDLNKLEEWSKKDIDKAVEQYLQNCFKDVSTLNSLRVDDFEFMINKVPEFRNLRPTMLDLLVQDYIEYSGTNTDNASALIDTAIRTHKLPADRDIIIDFELLKLKLKNSEISYPAENCAYMQGLDALQAKYGNDEAFDYAKGVAYKQMGDSQDTATDCREKALTYFERSIREGKNPYFIHNAQFYKERIIKPSVAIRQRCEDYIPAPKIRIPIQYYNLEKLFVSVYSAHKNSLTYVTEYDTNGNIIGEHLRDKDVQRLGKCIQLQEYQLKNPYKYRNYSTEIWLDSLPTGQYLLVFHPEREWDTSSTFLVSKIHVTDLKIAFWQMDSKGRIGVNDRTTGEPMNSRRVITKRQEGPVVLRNKVHYKKHLGVLHLTNKMGESKVSVGIKKSTSWWNSSTRDLTVFNHRDRYWTSYSHQIPYRNQIPSKKKRMVDMNSKQDYLFTDRTLYRPGQTLYFKVLVTEEGKTHNGCELEILLLDKDSKPVDSVTMATTEFGSAAGQFKLPAGNIGHYTLKVRYLSEKRWQSLFKDIEVVEYKLPTFKVTFERDSAETAMGDTLHIRGTVTSLNGVPVSNADVVLNITAQGNSIKAETTSDAEGKFTYALSIPHSDYSYNISYEAIATDINGETQQTRSSTHIRKKSIDINIYLLDDIDQAQKDTLRCIVKPVNHENILQAMPVKVEIQRMDMPKQYRPYLFEENGRPSQPIYSNEEYTRYFPQYTLNSAENSSSSWRVAETMFRDSRFCKPDSLWQISVKGWPMGSYKAVFSCIDKKGDTVKMERQFKITRSDVTHTQRFQTIWAEIINEPEMGEEVTAVVGTYLNNAIMMVDFYQGKHRLSTQRIVLDQEQKTLTFKTKKHGKRKVNVLARIVQNDHLYKTSSSYEFPTETSKLKKDANLDLKLTHWNKLLEPGSREHWELEIDHDKKPLSQPAELLAWMIDCSLYELGMYTPDYYLQPSYGAILMPKSQYIHLPNLRYQDISQRQIISINPYQIYQYTYLKKRQYESFNMGNRYRSHTVDVLDYSVSDATSTPGRSVRGNRSDGAMTIIDGVRVRSTDRNSKFEPEMVQTGGVINEVSFAAKATTDEIAIVEEESNDENTSENGSFAFSPDIQIRSNFVETAFFQPQLKTDAEGNIKLDFTLPDQYSKWQFFAVAHTTDMMTGNLTEFVQSRKSLMTQSNAPRFFREGDTMLFQVKVSNITDTLLKGKAAIRFFNPETDEPLYILQQSRDSLQDFTCAAKGTANVSWSIIIPKGVDAIGYRALAQADRYGDGEESAIPVLPNRGLMTESMHFTVPADEDTSFTFKRLKGNTSPTLTHYTYTMEITSNPAWIAIQSLPYLMQYQYECNEQIFSKLYANAIALHIVSHNPAIAETYEKWRNDTVHEALSSPLMQNEQLKNILLEETPWVWAAQRERRQRIEMANLFEKKNLENQINRQFKKLLNNQVAEGGWGWFANRYPSNYITNHIVAGYRKLQHLGIEVPEAKTMIQKAIRSMDTTQARAYRSYMELKKKFPKTVFYLTETDVQYLYARTFGKVDSAWLAQPYVKNLLTYATKGIFDANYTRQAEVALIMHRIGREKEAKEIMEAIRQQAVNSRELGMYWKSPYVGRKGCFYYPWYEAPIERQAILIEAFNEISPNEKELNAMKQWLLTQKKGNYWSNTKATAEAVYALLLNSSPEALGASATIITVGNETFTPGTSKDAEAGTGYMQHVWKNEEVTPQLAEVTVRTDRDHPAFGACYWQYFEDLDKVTSANDGLYVERALFHKSNTSDGAKLDSVTAANPVKLGEKITVRLVVRTDRDLEYVHVKDLRAAAFEPVNIHERYGWQNGVSYYESPRDCATNFFFSQFKKGTYILEYELIATQKGQFSHGVTTVECMYAPEYRAQSEGKRIAVSD